MAEYKKKLNTDKADTIEGNINSIETFGAVDGPGVRYIIFMQGCPMRCLYCHNPETWTDKASGSYTETPRQAFDKAYRYHNYWKNGGGITVSGGEALLQIEFVTELFRLCKEKNVHTALDTSGQPFNKEGEWLVSFNELMSLTDLFILDIKHIDPKKHKYLTGFDNSNILELARYLAFNGRKMWIRHVLVPGITADEEELKGLREFIDTLRGINLECIDRVEVLPYHTLGVAKYKKLGIEYRLRDVNPPTDDEIRLAKRILCED